MFSLPFVGLFVCVKAGLGKHCPAALYETWQRGGAREKKGPIKFLCGSGSPSSFNSEFVLIFFNIVGCILVGYDYHYTDYCQMLQRCRIMTHADYLVLSRISSSSWILEVAQFHFFYVQYRYHNLYICWYRYKSEIAYFIINKTFF